MAIPFLDNKKQNSSLSVLIDIGSSSIGVALVDIKKDSAPHIIASVREDIPFQDALSSTRFLHAMNRTLGKALESIQSKGLTKLPPSNVFCTLSAPWFLLKTRNLHISRMVEFEVNEHVLEGFINDDINVLKEELKNTLPSDDIRIIEKKIIQMRLNGYEIKNPYKQRTSKLEMAVTVGISSNKVIRSIEGKIHKYFHITPIHFGAFPVAAFSAIRDIFPHDRSFLFVDITGEATDISRVENDALSGSISFPYGKNFFIREVSTRLHTIHEEAASLFAMFLRDELHDERQAQIAEIVEWAENEWLARFERAVATLANNGILPNKIFFTIDADIEQLFSKVIAKAKSDVLMKTSFDVQYLDQLIISKFVSFEDNVSRDPFIVVEALFAKKITEQPIK